MQGLLVMDPKDRLTAKQALMHPFFDGLRSQEEDMHIQKERERGLKRVESSTNQRAGGTMSRSGDQSRSRSGLRNNKIIKPTNKQRFQPDNTVSEITNKSRSLGRKQTDKASMLSMPYGQSTNIRDSSVSNNSNPTGSSLAAYTSAANGSNKSKFNSNPSQQYKQMNNFMSNNLPNFYNQVNINNVRGAPNQEDKNYSYDINLNAVNKSLNNNQSGFNSKG